MISALPNPRASLPRKISLPTALNTAQGAPPGLGRHHLAALEVQPAPGPALQPIKLEDTAPKQQPEPAAAAAWHSLQPGGAATPTSVLIESRPGSGGSSNSSTDYAGASTGSSSQGNDTMGAEAWKRHRQQWTGRGGDCSGTCKRLPQKHVLNPYASYEDIIGPDGTLEQPVPLTEMIEVLVDSWLDEGFY